MSSRFYESKNSSRSLYGSVARTEPDMRQEMINLLDGKWPEISKKYPALLRKMRKDENNDFIPCPCVDPTTKEPDKDTFCNICFGEGKLWSEIWIDTYSVELGSDVGKAVREELISPGLMNVPLKTFYLRSSVDITEGDKIVEILLSKDGQPVKPYQRYKIFRISALIDLKSDNGKLEFWKVNCYEEKVKFLNG